VSRAGPALRQPGTGPVRHWAG